MTEETGNGTAHELAALLSPLGWRITTADAEKIA